jgi:hypothetical protein
MRSFFVAFFFAAFAAGVFGARVMLGLLAAAIFMLVIICISFASVMALSIFLVATPVQAERPRPVNYVAIGKGDPTA